MVITPMVAVKKMHSLRNKIAFVFCLVAIFSFASFSLVNAVNYGNGTYGAGFYSDTAPLTPVATPDAGTYNVAKTVSLSASESTSIRYSTSIMPSDCTSGTLYSDSTPILVSSSETIYVRACNGYGNSSTKSFVYIIDTTAPVISLVSFGTPNQTTATITWTTSEVADSQVEYGHTVSYGSSTTLDTNMVTLHSVPLSGLTAHTTYHFRVISKDVVANSSTSTDYTFITASLPDVTPPVLSSGAPIGTLSAGTTSTDISLSTDEVATCKYSMNANTAYASMTNTFNSTGSTSHSTHIDGLSNVNTYSFYIRCTDGLNNSNISDYIISFNIGNMSQRNSGGMLLSLIKNNNEVTVKPDDTASIKTEIEKINKNLKIGTISKDVKILQQFLISQNKGPSAKALKKNGATNNFGSLTKKALMEWQKANGLKPDGIFGVKAREKIKALGL